MDFVSLLLWHLAWNPRALYVSGAVLAVIGIVTLRSPFGILIGVFPFIIYWKATSLTNERAVAVTDVARSAVSFAGAKRVGVELADADCRTFLIPGSTPAPFGIRCAPEYTISAVYVCDAFFAIYPGTSLVLPTRNLQLATTGEEIYFRHVTAVNHRDGAIEVILARSSKSKLIAIGNDPNGLALLEALRVKLRNPQSRPPAISESATQALQALPAIADSATAGDKRYCCIRAGKLTEYYADPAVLNALMEKLQVPGTTATTAK